MKIIHDSDCAVHNEPAYPNGPCDCGAEMVEALEATNDNLRHELRECASELSILKHHMEVESGEAYALRADAMRYRAFWIGGKTVCFLGIEYFSKDALDLAIDTAIGVKE